MNIKALVEKRNAKKVELDQMLEVCEKEVRALTSEEDVKFTEIENEIRELDKTIEKLEARAKETAVEVTEFKAEAEKKEGEKRDMEDMTLEQEKRGLEQLIRHENGEELRSISTTNNGEVIPTHLSKNIIKLLDEVAPLYGLVPKLTPVNGYLEILKESSIGNAAFVGESTNLSAEDFSMEKVKLEQRRCGAVIELTQHIINDSGIDIVNYATDVLYRRLGKALDTAIVAGLKNGNSFEGLNTCLTAEEVETSVQSAVSIDDLMRVMNSMHPDLQDGAVWVMSRKLFNEISLLKDGVGNYYMTRQLNIVDNKPEYRLFGHKIYISDAVSVSSAAGSRIAYFVNFQRAYAGMVKKGVQFKNISGDTQNSLKGTTTLMLEIYADCKIVDDRAIKVVTRKKA